MCLALAVIGTIVARVLMTSPGPPVAPAGRGAAAMRFPPNRNACGIRFRQTADIHTAKGSYVANNGVRATYSSPHHHCGSS